MDNNNPILIAPSILSADYSNIVAEIKRVEEGGADMLHLDVMDGNFVPNITFGYKFIADIRKHTRLRFDVHLMINNPENLLDKFIEAGANSISIHPETSKDAAAVLSRINAAGLDCGVVLNPDSPIGMINNYLGVADFVLVMSVFPGFGGQKFIDASIARIKKVKSMIGEADIAIEVDGGINLDNISAIKRAGASIIVSGKTIFSAQNPREIMEKMRQL